MTPLDQAPLRRHEKRIGFAANLLISFVAIVLALGSLELFTRAFVTVRVVGPAFTDRGSRGPEVPTPRKPLAQNTSGRRYA